MVRLRAGVCAGSGLCGREDGENTVGIWGLPSPRGFPSPRMFGGDQGTLLGTPPRDLCGDFHLSLGDIKALVEPKPSALPRRENPTSSPGDINGSLSQKRPWSLHLESGNAPQGQGESSDLQNLRPSCGWGPLRRRWSPSAWTWSCATCGSGRAEPPQLVPGAGAPQLMVAPFPSHGDVDEEALPSQGCAAPQILLPSPIQRGCRNQGEEIRGGTLVWVKAKPSGLVTISRKMSIVSRMEATPSLLA